MTDAHHPPRWRVALVREAEGLRFTTDVLRTSADVAHAFAFLGDRDREEFWLAALDQRHRIIATHQVSIGTLTASLVHPREVAKVLVLCSAAACVLIHNLCAAPHKTCYVPLVFMCSTPSDRCESGRRAGRDRSERST